MAHNNTSNPGVRPNFSELWLVTHMTVDWLAVIRFKYHVYSHAVCGLSPKEVLETTKIDVSMAQLKCGLRLPLSKFLRQMCEVREVCPASTLSTLSVTRGGGSVA